MIYKDEIFKFIKRECKKEGPITLSSGLSSSVYYDLKKAMLFSYILRMISYDMMDHIVRLKKTPNAIGGLALGAVPLVIGLINQYEYLGTSIQGCIVRKESKDHGTKARVENPQSAGTRIYVVDDVITTGKSIAEACEEFLKCDYKIIGILAVLDREQGGMKMLTKKYGCPVHTLFKMSEFN